MSSNQFSSKCKYMHEEGSTHSTVQEFTSLRAKQFNNGLSFGNLKNKENVQTPRGGALKGQGNSNRKKVKELNSPECRKKYKNNDILECYEMENASLKKTVEILKEQVEAYSTNYQLLKKQGQSLRKVADQQQNQWSRRQEKYKLYKKKSKEYDNLLPKIEQLQVLQDNLIVQNETMKKKEAELRSLLANILMVAGNNQDPAVKKIRNLIKDSCQQI